MPKFSSILPVPKKVFAFILSLLFGSQFAFSQALFAFPDTASVETLVRQYMEAQHIPGMAVAIVQHKKIVYAKGFGRANAQQDPVTANTSFVLASLSKSFTALAVMQLVEADKLDLDAPLKQYIPWFTLTDTLHASRITIRHLLYHRSGIPRITSYQTNYPDITLESKARRLAGIEPGRKLGTFQYANDNYAILGLLIETVSGMSYPEYIRDQIFAPLGMADSYADPVNLPPGQLAEGHRWHFGIPVRTGIAYHPANRPNGGLMSSAHDMATYLLAHLYPEDSLLNPVISSQGMHMLHTPPQKGDYAMGWGLAEIEGEKTLLHRGSLADYGTFMAFLPEREMALVVLRNANSGLLRNDLNAIPMDIFTLMIGKPVDPSPTFLNTPYLIFLGISGVILLFILFGTYRLIRKPPIPASPKEKRKARLEIIIVNFLTPVVAIGIFTYLAHGPLISLAKGQYDLFAFFYLLFGASLLFGGLKWILINRKLGSP